MTALGNFTVASRSFCRFTLRASIYTYNNVDGFIRHSHFISETFGNLNEYPELELYKNFRFKPQYISEITEMIDWKIGSMASPRAADTF